MNKFLKQFFLFSLLPVLFICLNLVFSERGKYPHFYLHYQEILEKNVNAEVIILGNSIATHSIRPSYLKCSESSIFNFALNGANPIFFVDWYDKIFSKYYSKPKYCIYVVDDYTLSRGWHLLEHDLIYMPGELLLNPNGKSIISTNTIHGHLSELFKSNFEKIKHPSKIKSRSLFLMDEYDNGFVPLARPKKLQALKAKLPNEACKNSNAKEFQQLIAQMEADGVKLIFVMPPQFSHNKDYFEASPCIQYLQDFARINEIPFLNYNIERRHEDINPIEENFSDRIHMSPVGSKIFSEVLNEDLCALINL